MSGSLSQSSNVLQVGASGSPAESSPAEVVQADIFGFGPVDRLSTEQIQSMRESALGKIPGLLIGQYTLSPLLLNYARLDQPWQSAAEKYLDGPLQQATFTAPAAELDLANPILLLRPEFHRLGGLTQLPWNIDYILNNYSPKMRAFPFAPRPSAIELNRKESKITVTYNLSAFLVISKQWMEGEIDLDKETEFSIVAYNAADLGFPFVQFNPSDTQGIYPAKAPNTEIVRSYWYFQYDEAGCLNGQGCNKHAGFFMPHLYSFKFKSVPARIAFRLYRTRPDQEDQDSEKSGDIAPVRYEILFQ